MDKRQFFGKGKLEELTQFVRRQRDITSVVLGVDMLSALQLATLQDLWGVAVYDRSAVTLSVTSSRDMLRNSSKVSCGDMIFPHQWQFDSGISIVQCFRNVLQHPVTLAQ